jgi:uncharacterized membrane protein
LVRLGNLRRAHTPFACAAALASALAVAAGTSPAAAEGVVRIQQNDGSVQVYSNVSIHLVKNKALTIATADGKGKLIVDKAACSYEGELQRCLLYGVWLDQGGTTKQVDLQQGTVYVNLTAEKQQLPLSSQQLPPKGIVLALSTKVGTYISLNGIIDGEAK